MGSGWLYPRVTKRKTKKHPANIRSPSLCYSCMTVAAMYSHRDSVWSSVWRHFLGLDVIKTYLNGHLCGFDHKMHRCFIAALIFRSLVALVSSGAFKRGCLNKSLKTADFMCPPFLSFMLASAEGQCPAAGAFQSAAGEGRPAGLCVRPRQVRLSAEWAECCYQEQRAAAHSAAAEEEQTAGIKQWLSFIGLSYMINVSVNRPEHVANLVE